MEQSTWRCLLRRGAPFGGCQRDVGGTLARPTGTKIARQEVDMRGMQKMVLHYKIYIILMDASLLTSSRDCHSYHFYFSSELIKSEIVPISI